MKSEAQENERYCMPQKTWMRNAPAEGERRKPTRRTKRLVFLAVSGVIGAGVALYARSKVSTLSIPLAILIVGLICVPALWQLFAMPERYKTKDYCLSAALYLTFWGGPVMLYVLTLHKSGVTQSVGYVYLGALLLSWGLGAFLKRR